VDDDALEALIADVGHLLVQMEKFRAHREPEARALRADCLAIGDRARRAHRRGTLDAALAGALAADAARALARARAWLVACRDRPAYRAAVAAHARADWPTLAATLPDVFDGLAATTPPVALYAPVAWQRRGRPRPPVEVAEDCARLAREGLAGEGEPDVPGADPALPAVVLRGEPPLGEPACLVVGGGDLPPCVLRLEATGDYLVPARRLVVRVAVRLARDDAELDEWTLDPAGYRAELAAALAARGVAVADGG
jgi:hypothetical protein